MADALRHRGPDHFGFYNGPGVVLIHRRLAVIDLRVSASQPMCDRDRRYWIVFNGEIYNYRALREELIAAGHTFKTDSDTEVLLSSYMQWETGCLAHLNGMFAFAVWDSHKRSLFLARDRLGKKPLFYFRTASGLIFASELKALLRHPHITRTVNVEAISHFLSLNYLPGHECIVKGVDKLPAAHFMKVDGRGAGKPVCYWDLASYYRNKDYAITVDSAAEELTALIHDAVKLRLTADVPVGAFLSGGTDSSIVAASMVQAQGGAKVQTFSIGFDQPGYSELPHARSVSKFLDVEHHDQSVGGSVAQCMRDIVYFADEPFADTSIVPTYFLSRFARHHVTVSLSGDGADELFAGYETYVADDILRMLARMPKSVVSLLGDVIVHLLPTSFDKVSLDYKARQFFSGLHLNAERAHCHWRYIFSEAEKRSLLRDDVSQGLSDMDPFSYFKRYFDDLPDAHFLDRTNYVDIKTWLVDDVLVKVDRASMAHALEVRCPLLDRRIVEFAAKLPPWMKLKGLKKKFILKKAGGRILPQRIVDVPKRGFNAPVSYWLLGELRELAQDITLGQAISQWVNRQVVQQMWREHETGRRDHGLKLFGIMCLGLWLERFPSFKS